MKTLETKERLLQEVLGEGGYAEYRAQVYGASLSAARTRRKIRRINQFVAGFTGIAGLAALIHLIRSPSVSDATPLPFSLVRSQPIPEDEIVRTGESHLPAVRTWDADLVRVQQTYALDTVRTVTDYVSVPRISDQALLALFEGYPRALIATGRHQKKLLFLTRDGERFLNQAGALSSGP